MYKGIGVEKGKCIEEEFALGYAMQRIMQNKEEKQELVKNRLHGFFICTVHG